MTGFTDHQAASRAGVDQSARQSGYPLFPRGWDDLDPERHTVACSENWTPIRSSWGRFRVTCGDCRHICSALTRGELRALMAEHLDG